MKILNFYSKQTKQQGMEVVCIKHWYGKIDVIYTRKL